jgi:perosamine synthetase
MIPVNRPLLDGNEKKYLAECIDSGWVGSDGPFVSRFETEFAASVNRKYGIAVSSGTAALDISVEALDIGIHDYQEDEVIMPTFTIISCINQIMRKCAAPVFVDSDLHTWNMNVNQIESRITPATKAIMAVHTYGLPVDMDPVMDIARKHDLKIIEDAAQAHGMKYKGRPCGSFGDLSTFSFYSNKLVSCGEGGMIVTNDELLAEKCRSLRNLCFGPQRFVHERIGWNYRMSNMQAAVGLAQLEKLEIHANIKRQIGKMYDRLLRGRNGISLPSLKTDDDIRLPVMSVDGGRNMYWVFGVVIDKMEAQEVMARMHCKGIQTRPFFYPMHLQPAFSCTWPPHTLNYDYPVAEHLYKHGLYLPSGVGTTAEEVDMAATALKEILQ